MKQWGGSRQRKGRGEDGERKMEGKTRSKGIIVWYSLRMYETLLLTPLSCSSPTISIQKYGFEQNSENEYKFVP